MFSPIATQFSPNLPGNLTSISNSWAARRNNSANCFKRTKNGRPLSAAGVVKIPTEIEAEEEFRFDNDFQGTGGLPNIRPQSAGVNRSSRGRESGSRPSSAQGGRYQSDEPLGRSHHFGASVGNLGVQEPRLSSANRTRRDIPDFVEKDKQVARFFGHFNQKRPWDEGPLGVPGIETTIVRHVTIFFFLYDQTVEIFERKLENSGMQGGKFASRRVLKDNKGYIITLRDLAPGNVINVLGQDIYITAVDEFTGKLLKDQLNIEVPFSAITNVIAGNLSKVDVDGAPLATGLGDRSSATLRRSKGTFVSEEATEKRASLEKVNKFLRYDGQVLRFFCLELSANAISSMLKSGELVPSPKGPDSIGILGSLRDSQYKLKGDEKQMGLLYFLSDSCMEVRAMKSGVTDTDTACVVRRCKVAKNWRDAPDSYSSQYFEPTDLICGNLLDLFGKRLLILSCNDFTSKIYSSLHIHQRTITTVAVEETVSRGFSSSFYGDGYLQIGANSEEMANKESSLDRFKWLRNQRRTLRCTLKYAFLNDKAKQENSRIFMLSYFFEDDTVQIYEEVIKNSGYAGGNFLKRGKYKNSLPVDGGEPRDFLPTDIYVGNVISVNGHEMRIVEMDKSSIHLCESYPELFPMFDDNEVVKSKLGKIVAKRIDLRNHILRNIDTEDVGIVSKSQFISALSELGLCSIWNEQEVLTLLNSCKVNANLSKDEVDRAKFSAGGYFYKEVADLISYTYANSQLFRWNSSRNGVLENFLTTLRKRNAHWRPLFQRDWSSVGNYITMTHFLQALVKGGVPEEAIREADKQCIVERYRVTNEEEEDRILQKVRTRHNNSSGAHKHDVSCINVKLIGDRSLNGVGLEAPKKYSESSIKSRRNQLIASSSYAAFVRADGVNGASTNDYYDYVINYNDLCDDMYNADWA